MVLKLQFFSLHSVRNDYLPLGCILITVQIFTWLLICYVSDVCEEQVCGQNAVCQGRGHRPFCECPQGFEGDPLAGCERKS